MYSELYKAVLECSRHSTFEDSTSLAGLATLYRKANDIASVPGDTMSYEDRCMRTAKLEYVIADIQDMMFINTSSKRRMIALMYENVATAIKKYKSLDQDSVSWNEAFIEALQASIEVAEFERDIERANNYRKVIPFYRSLCDLAEARVSLDVNSADWHDVMTRVYNEKTNIALARDAREHIDAFKARATMHRDAAIAIRLNESLSVGSLAWFVNAEKLHRVVNRLEADPNSIASEW